MHVPELYLKKCRSEYIYTPFKIIDGLTFSRIMKYCTETNSLIRSVKMTYIDDWMNNSI